MRQNSYTSVIKKFQINTKQTICLSGTPFKAIAKGEFTNDNTFTYSYFDEQRNKYPKSEDGDFRTINPDYAHFPDMKIFGYNMSHLFANMTASVFSGDMLYGNNIPKEYKGALYRRWYCDSFKRAVKDVLTPQIPYEKGKSVEDADNVMKHILARLFEFLYISVYRETTFQEIFNNADPNMFLEAVGITKKDFEILNKYRVFQENVLNNYIHQFFVNESLGSKLNLEDEEVKRQYRNSFDWFGFGLEYEPPTDAEDTDDSDVSVVTEINSTAEPVQTKSLYDEIVEILRRNPDGLKSVDIAKQLGVSKKEINRILYVYINVFDPGDKFFWRLR